MAKKSITYGVGTIANTSVTNAIISDPVVDILDVVLEIKESLAHIEERLAILEPHLQDHEQYPALKEAYDQYKTVEKLMKKKDD